MQLPFPFLDVRLMNGFFCYRNMNLTNSITRTLFLLTALTTIMIAQISQPQQNPCTSKLTCHDCIQTPSCAWCYAPVRPKTFHHNSLYLIYLLLFHRILKKVRDVSNQTHRSPRRRSARRSSSTIRTT